MNTLIEAENQKSIQLDTEARKFICDFILEGTVGLLINDIKNKEHYDRKKRLKTYVQLLKQCPISLFAFPNTIIIRRHN